MITTFRGEYKKPVVEQTQQHVFLGFFEDFVINPKNGQFEALWIKTKSNKLRLILPEDIIRWNRNKIIINSESDILDISDMPRIKKLCSKEVSIMKSKVIFKDKCLGRVHDFGFDTLTPLLLNLFIDKGILFWKKIVIVPRKSIDRITKEGIFLTESTLKTKRAFESTTSLPEMEEG